MPNDVLGIASHEEALEAPPPVSATRDQMGRPGVRFRDDHFTGAIAERFDQPLLHLDVCRADGRSWPGAGCTRL